MTMAKLETKSLNLWYGSFQALNNVSLAIRPNAITAIIGPSGCGKSTLLRVFNRMNETIPHVRIEGEVLLDQSSIYDSSMDLRQLRKRVGMVFQRPNPFPLSVFENVAYGPKIHNFAKSDELSGRVETALRQTGLWDNSQGPPENIRAFVDAGTSAAPVHLATAGRGAGGAAHG